MPKAVAAMAFEQDALAAIENFRDVEAGGLEGFAELVSVLDHRRAGRRTDHVRPIVGRDDDGSLGRRKRGEVLFLVVERTVVKVRPVAEDGDAQARQIWKDRNDVRPRHRPHVELLLFHRRFQR